MTIASERFLVTGALGCIGAWTVRALVRDGADVTAFDLGTDARRLRLILSDEELAGVHFEVGDITDLAQVERVLDAAGHHQRHPPRGVTGPVLPSRPTTRCARQRRRHRQRLRGGPASRRADGAGRVHELDGRLHRRRRRSSDGPPDGHRPTASAQPLWRVQACERGQRADLLAGQRRRERRRPADDRLWRRARPGHDERPDQGDRGGCAWDAVPRVVQRSDAVPVRR